jgi:hypothetical protein
MAEVEESFWRMLHLLGVWQQIVEKFWKTDSYNVGIIFLLGHTQSKTTYKIFR